MLDAVLVDQRVTGDARRRSRARTRHRAPGSCSPRTSSKPSTIRHTAAACDRRRVPEKDDAHEQHEDRGSAPGDGIHDRERDEPVRGRRAARSTRARRRHSPRERPDGPVRAPDEERPGRRRSRRRSARRPSPTRCRARAPAGCSRARGSTPRRARRQGRTPPWRRRYALTRMSALAVVFDFNGTLSDDEPVLCGSTRSSSPSMARPLTERSTTTSSRVTATRRSSGRWLGRVPTS